jgi:phosphoribosylformylglycinamidine cyclo-ligase
VIVAADHAETAKAHLLESGENVYTIGSIRLRQAGEAQTIVV